MRVVIQRDTLSEGLAAVLDIVPSKTALPVLSNILIETEDDGSVRLSATDLDISIQCSIAADVDEPGSTTVPARKFAEIIREMPGEPMVLEAEEGRVTLRRQDKNAGSYKLMTVPAEDFPELPDTVEGPEMDFTGASYGEAEGHFLGGMISKTAYAVSRDETRPVLTGVLWQVFENRMTMVATDGARLVQYTKAIPPGQGGSIQEEAIVPTRALNHMTKLLSAGFRLQTVRFGQNHLLVHLTGSEQGATEGTGTATGQIRLYSRLIEGPYVDFGQVIPKSNSKRLKLPMASFGPAVRRVAVLASSQTRQIRLNLSENRVEMTASSQEIGGEAREAISADYGDEEMVISYNSVYLLDILRRIDSDEVVFELDSAVTAGIIRPGEQPEGEDYLCLLMPLRLTE
jgi:DNA polymerase III subunit beta